MRKLFEVGEIIGNNALEVYEVTDDSMKPEICAGDLIVTDIQAELEDGKTAAVGIGGETVLCRIERKAGNIALVPLNPAYPVTVYPEDKTGSAPRPARCVRLIRYHDDKLRERDLPLLPRELGLPRRPPVEWDQLAEYTRGIV